MSETTSKNLRVIHVFIASPGDLGEERRKFAEVVAEVNRLKANGMGLHLEPLGWKDIPAGAGRPQDLINREISKCGLFVLLLWKRWGMSTGVTSSGTEEEFELARALRQKNNGVPEMMLYFRDVPPEFLEDPGAQLKKVLAFRERLDREHEFLYHTFANPEAWEDKFRSDLSGWLDTFGPTVLDMSAGHPQNVERPGPAFAVGSLKPAVIERTPPEAPEQRQSRFYFAVNLRWMKMVIALSFVGAMLAAAASFMLPPADPESASFIPDTSVWPVPYQAPQPTDVPTPEPYQRGTTRETVARAVLRDTPEVPLRNEGAPEVRTTPLPLPHVPVPQPSNGFEELTQIPPPVPTPEPQEFRRLYDAHRLERNNVFAFGPGLNSAYGVATFTGSHAFSGSHAFIGRPLWQSLNLPPMGIQSLDRTAIFENDLFDPKTLGFNSSSLTMALGLRYVPNMSVAARSFNVSPAWSFDVGQIFKQGHLYTAYAQPSGFTGIKMDFDGSAYAPSYGREIARLFHNYGVTYSVSSRHAYLVDLFDDRRFYGSRISLTRLTLASVIASMSVNDFSFKPGSTTNLFAKPPEMSLSHTGGRTRGRHDQLAFSGARSPAAFGPARAPSSGGALPGRPVESSLPRDGLASSGPRHVYGNQTMSVVIRGGFGRTYSAGFGLQDTLPITFNPFGNQIKTTAPVGNPSRYTISLQTAFTF